MAERCIRPAPLGTSGAALLQDSSQALLGRAAGLHRPGASVRSRLGKSYLAGFEVDRRGLLSVGQMSGQREGRKLYGAFLQLVIRNKDETQASYISVFFCC